MDPVLKAVLLSWDFRIEVILILGLVMATLLVMVLLRYGLLAFAAAFLTLNLLSRFPITLDLSAWYVGASVLALGTVTLLALYGFLVSLAGRPLFRIDLLED